jgi:hypothetical protein
MATYPPLVPALCPRAEVHAHPIATGPLKRLGAPGLTHPLRRTHPTVESDVEVRAHDMGGDGGEFADNGAGMHESGMDVLPPVISST